jgi:DNA polymerase III delta prime subunit
VSGDHNQHQKPDVVTLTASDLKTIRVREVEIEFKEWLDPHIGVIPINPKTPLILKAVIREEV